jgi:hypothetical protein
MEDQGVLQMAFDSAWDSAVPHRVLIDAGGKLLCKKLRSVDMLELRRTILAYLPSDYIGLNQYWLAGAAAKQPEKSGR